jgi:GDP-mannose 6-dehydrogenase
MELFVKDKQLNISPYYFKPGFAYGGSCLPKDLKGLQTLAHDNYIKVPVIESIDKTNLIQVDRAIEVIGKYKDKKIGILGLSFKAGTDDLRNSPTVTLVETLLGKGYNISIFDRNVAISDLTGTNKEYITTHIPHLSKLMINNASDMIAGSDVLVVTTKEKEFSDLLKNVDDKLIIDLVCMDGEIRKKENYYGINW